MRGLKLNENQQIRHEEDVARASTSTPPIQPRAPTWNEILVKVFEAPLDLKRAELQNQLQGQQRAPVLERHLDNTRLKANISFHQVYLESQSMEFISIEYQRVICDESERSENDFNYVQSGYLSDFHRSTLVNWLFELGEEYKFTPETNHLCIIIMDRYMARYCKLTCGKKIPTSRLQLIACGSILLASKLNVSFGSFSADQIFLLRRDIQRKFQTLLIPVPTNMMKINSKESKPKYSKRSNGISIIQEQVTRIDY